MTFASYLCGRCSELGHLGLSCHDQAPDTVGARSWARGSRSSSHLARSPGGAPQRASSSGVSASAVRADPGLAYRVPYSAE